MASNQLPQHDHRRPAMISELAARASQNDWNENGAFKYFLRLAERYRKEAKEAVARNDLEEAFVAFARSATIVLEILPVHRDYLTSLSNAQRNNLTLNGQELLENLGHLKRILLERFDDWQAQHPDRGDTPPPTLAQLQQEQQMEHDRTVAEEARRSQQEADLVRRGQVEQPRHPPPPPDHATNSAVPFAQSAQGISSMELSQRNQRQQEEMQSRSQELMRRKQEEKLRTHASSPSISSTTGTSSGSSMTMPTPSIAATSSAPSLSSSATMYHAASKQSAVSFQPPPVSHPNMYRSISQQAPTILPLENPSRFEDDSTDSEQDSRTATQRYATPTKSTRGSYPPPLTTMSPPPPDRIEYPKLMNVHQKTQGYRPSQDSMFTQTWNRDHYSLSDAYSHPQRENYHPLPRPPSQPPYTGPNQSAPAPPIPTETKPSLTPSGASETSNGLKIVHLPRDCLNRFLTIAKVNTARDRETCGLLLGKDRGSKFVVTTLLIPKQHSTSDTCTMDEEELILQVTEERGLITLGWIHTHPSQSCFMSSVDLHTHSAFQRMLPESFAVVCAPSSVPNFGIFRLTDPPGLGLILACNAKEAFHPHPDAPIYTDAERGHVQMKDISLEIVDLR
ncbi:Mov34-domain-containing protein [Lentinula edodes]|uniref:Mov34-domain-containing protein n=1 Tax=Lentinula edodes TaxID=5353 RepID=A0A1Q3EJG2_LENED|nr:uncharacterized protein C8R40DRAFT_1142945 [Lentinula edodes]KAH7878242.1 hypothetical protein C8R40DRAFT_1142945 [Lentinula edodes]GAW07335.1 Mov34-domain-containing protein [Lentinula edodes]